MSKKKTVDKIPATLFKQIIDNMPIVSVEAVIILDNAFLLMRRKNEPAKGEWWFPGGRIYKGETFEQTLYREIKEETGLKVTAYKFINIYSRIFLQRHDITIAYLCKCEGNITLNSEHSEYKLFKEAPKDLHPYLLNLIEDASNTDL